MDLIQRSLADAQHQRAFLLQADIRGPFNQVRAGTVGDPSERTHAAGDNHHGVSRIRTTRDIRSDVHITLFMNFTARGADDLTDDPAASAKIEFLGQYSKSAVGGDEVHSLNSAVALDRQQQLFEEQGAAGARGRNGQVLGWVVGQGCTES